MFPRLALADFDWRARLDRVVDVAQRNATDRASEPSPTVFTGKGGHQASPAQRLQDTADDYRIRVHAAGQGCRIHDPTGKGERSQDMNGKVKLLVDHGTQL